MKKLLVLVSVLALAVSANAALVQLQANESVNPGDIVTVSLFTDAAVGDFTVVSINDGVAGGVASNVVINSGFDWAMFTGVGELNDGGYLVQNVTGKTDFGSPAVSGILFSFDYQVNAAVGETVVISADGNAGGTAIGGVSLNVVPEPITVALLGLGGLFIRRRK